MQAMSFERVALAVNHESALTSLESALREIISLQGIVLDQAQQVCIWSLMQMSVILMTASEVHASSLDQR